MEVEFKDALETLRNQSSDDLEVVEKRLEETRQLAERGTDFDTNGYEREFTLSILDASYEYSKDGLREACTFQCDHEHGDFGWFRTDAKSHANLSSDDKKYRLRRNFSCLSEYLEDRVGEEAVEWIENCNRQHGFDSYDDDPIYGACFTKFLRLRAQGFDVRKYATFQEFYEDATKEGYFLGNPEKGDHTKVQYNSLKRAFDSFKSGAMKDEYDQRYSEMIRYNAGLQIALENCSFEGNDRESRSVILMRTEHTDVINPDGTSLEIGDVCHHRRGANDSFSVYSTVRINGGELTMTRVPYSRINCYYMLQPKEREYMYAGDDQNEFTADAHGLPAYYIAKDIPKKRGILARDLMVAFKNAEKAEMGRRTKANKK